jgi:large subunit ribosomal protein L32e
MVKVRGHKAITKKTDKTFLRWHAHRFQRLGQKWRRPRGIDNPLRRHYKGKGNTPGIGYGKDKKTKHMERNGLIKFVVHNLNELNLLMMHNRRYSAVVAHNVGAHTRKLIVARANELDIHVDNKAARLKSEEKK